MIFHCIFSFNEEKQLSKTNQKLTDLLHTMSSRIKGLSDLCKN